MKWLKRILVTFFVLIVLICTGVFLYLQSHKPSYSGELKISGLKEQTDVYFDAYGVPHIYGQSEEDVFRALGYIHAKERLFQMELIRRVSSGRLSEIFGSSVLDVDRFFRMLGIAEQAKQSATEFKAQAGEPIYIAAKAYLDGLNEYIENGKTPLEFTLLGIPKEKFEIKDLYLVVSYVSFNFQMAFRTDPLLDRIKNKWGIEYLEELGIQKDSMTMAKDTALSVSNVLSEGVLLAEFDAIHDKLPFQTWTGSNAMVIAAKRSSSGKVLFENDTHIGHQQPSVWYESHLEYPGFRFYGSWIAGFPFAALGHTQRHAWGLTIFENDDLDFYKEKINPDNVDQFWEVDRWSDMKIRPETIHVKDSADITIRCRSTAHGPVCSDVMKDFEAYGSVPVSACWTFLREPNNILEVTYGLAHSLSMTEFESYVAKLAAPGLNVLYGDAENNIAWWAAAKITKRSEKSNPAFVMDASTGDDDWLGYYDFSLNPSSVNPESGYVYSSNQTPSPVQGIVYPGYYLPDDRSMKLKSLLEGKHTFALKDLQNFNLENVNPVTEQACKLLLKQLDTKSFQGDRSQEKLVSILQSWKGGHDVSDVAPSFYYRWYYYVYQKTFTDELGLKDAAALLKTHIQKSNVLTWLSDENSVWWDDVNSKDRVETMQEIVNESYYLALRDFNAQYGTDPALWNWGKVHTLELEHPLGKQWPLNYLFNVGPYPINGGIETLNNQSFLFDSLLAFRSTLGAALRRTVDFADPENGMSVIPGGQSGNPMSPHYSDQTELYVKGELRKEMMNKNEIEASCKNKLVFMPK
jgi:penicillin amidase